MGTELQYAIPIDVLAAANFSLNYCVDDCTCNLIIMKHKAPEDSNSWRIQLRDLMDRVLDQHNQEIIKKTMQTHEEVFKQQVRELHRLYSIQRMLMEELKKESRHGREEDQAAGPSTRLDESDEDLCGVDLTLSIGIGGSSSTGTASKNKSIGCWESSSSNNDNTKNRSRGGDGEDCNAMSRSSNSAATVDQQQQQIKRTPHWLSQGFSLNDRTH
ncbi:hypothetical protein Ancab_017747 [Ancistrocladus abbreviatus]